MPLKTRLRRFAKSLALAAPPIRRLHAGALAANANNAELRRAVREMTVLIERGSDELRAENLRLRNEIKGWRAENALLRRRLNGQPIEAPTCPICAGTEVTMYSTDALHTGTATPIYACIGCGHKFVHPLPPPEQVAAWYQGVEYFSGMRAFDPLGEGFVGARMKAIHAHVIERFGLRGDLRIGEIGCLEGFLLKRLAADGHQVVGFEINAKVAKMSRRAHALDIRCVNFEEDEVSVSGLDVVASFHTFEHLRSPARALAKAAAMLRPGGGILLEVPCDDDEMDNEDHFQFFTAQSLRRLLEAEFVDVELFPNQYLRQGQYDLDSLYGVGRRA
jgi:SAM-dependent methyltransferase